MRKSSSRAPAADDHPRIIVEKLQTIRVYNFHFHGGGEVRWPCVKLVRESYFFFGCNGHIIARDNRIPVLLKNRLSRISITRGRINRLPSKRVWNYPNLLVGHDTLVYLSSPNVESIENLRRRPTRGCGSPEKYSSLSHPRERHMGDARVLLIKYIGRGSNCPSLDTAVGLTFLSRGDAIHAAGLTFRLVVGRRWWASITPLWNSNEFKGFRQFVTSELPKGWQWSINTW